MGDNPIKNKETRRQPWAKNKQRDTIWTKNKELPQDERGAKFSLLKDL